MRNIVFHILVMYTDTCHMRPSLTSLVLFTICIRDRIHYKLWTRRTFVIILHLVICCLSAMFFGWSSTKFMGFFFNRKFKIRKNTDWNTI